MAILARLRRRQDAATSAFLVFPLFLVYQFGILLGARGRNGADFVTTGLMRLVEYDLGAYLTVLVALAASYAGLFAGLRRGGRAEVRSFGPTLAESALYALVMGSLILAVMQWLSGLMPGLVIVASGPLDVIVISAGAGLHEELIFRAGLMSGLAVACRPLGARRAALLAVLGSSLVFSAAHHVGPSADAFTLAAFVYRTFAGIYFAALYHFRGFAVAAWTHALYDVYVLSLLRYA